MFQRSKEWLKQLLLWPEPEQLEFDDYVQQKKQEQDEYPGERRPVATPEAYPAIEDKGGV